MATLTREIRIDNAAARVWDAVRDAGNAHTRLTPGVLADCRLDGDARVVTFANGLAVRELIVTIDDAARRISYAAVGGKMSHHNASMQVFDEGARRCRLVWIADLLPDAIAPAIAGLMDKGCMEMKETLASA